MISEKKYSSSKTWQKFYLTFPLLLKCQDTQIPKDALSETGKDI